LIDWFLLFLSSFIVSSAGGWMAFQYFMLVKMDSFRSTKWTE